MANLQNVQAAAKSLVERARLGDENAMGMITVVREQAHKGNEKAKIALRELEDYATAHPPPERDPDIGAEAEKALTVLDEVGPIVGLPILLKLPSHGSEALFAASVVLANSGTAIGAKRVDEIAKTIDKANLREIFFYAFENSHKGIRDEAAALTREEQRYFYAGMCVGLANNIQRVRRPDTFIARFSPAAGWELGEVVSGKAA